MSTDTAAPGTAVDLDEAPVARRAAPEAPTRPPAKAAAPAAPAPSSPAAGREHWVVPLAVLIVGMFMSVLDTSIVNVAISAIQTDFGGSTADVAWISTAYSLVLGVVDHFRPGRSVHRSARTTSFWLDGDGGGLSLIHI